ncbi:hypothetical protein EJ02DRAFT_424955 [Clathrospora elynae]|uniref:Uncharacterized protein n=1 Tax=Clathrospora elynae TaxID=706981 RepID=A0A6A5SL86_9PLEO|nr:hypothetical protein EJ02DRAFT_424955 [Clathrospora elynae]
MQIEDSPRLRNTVTIFAIIVVVEMRYKRQNPVISSHNVLHYETEARIIARFEATSRLITRYRKHTPKIAASAFLMQAFLAPADFEALLECEHATTPSNDVKIAKKSSSILSISAPESVEVALCYAWIDGRTNALDDNWRTVRYTPRRAKSIWS